MRPHRVAGVHVEIGQAGSELLLEVLRAIEPPRQAAGTRIEIRVGVVPEVFVLPVVKRRRHGVQPVVEDAECHPRQLQPLAGSQCDRFQLGKEGRRRQRTGRRAVHAERPSAQVFQGHEPAVLGALLSMQGRPRHQFRRAVALQFAAVRRRDGRLLQLALVRPRRVRRSSRSACRTRPRRRAAASTPTRAMGSTAGWAPEFSSSTHCRKIGVPGNAST